MAVRDADAEEGQRDEEGQERERWNGLDGTRQAKNYLPERAARLATIPSGTPTMTARSSEKPASSEMSRCPAEEFVRERFARNLWRHRNIKKRPRA